MCLHWCEQFWNFILFFQIYHVICVQYGVTKEWLCHLSVGCLGNFGVRHWTWVGCYTSSCYKRHWLLLDAWCVRGLDFSLGTHLWKCFAGIRWNELLGHGTALPKCAVPEHAGEELLEGQDVPAGELDRSLPLGISLAFRGCSRVWALTSLTALNGIIWASHPRPSEKIHWLI